MFSLLLKTYAVLGISQCKANCYRFCNHPVRITTDKYPSDSESENWSSRCQSQISFPCWASKSRNHTQRFLQGFLFDKMATELIYSQWFFGLFCPWFTKTTMELLYRKLRIITTTYCLSKFSVVLEYSRFDRQSGKCRMVDSDLILICSYCHSLKNRFNLLLNVLNYSVGPGRISSPSDCKVCGIHTSAVQIWTPLLQILYIQNKLEVRKFESTELERW